jgi:hypothetical protein
MIKISGLDKLQRDLKTAQDALKDLDGELGSVSFNPVDPESIQQAITTVEAIIDERVAEYRSNKFVESLADQMKESYRSMIINKAATARIQDDE